MGLECLLLHERHSSREPQYRCAAPASWLDVMHLAGFEAFRRFGSLLSSTSLDAEESNEDSPRDQGPFGLLTGSLW